MHANGRISRPREWVSELQFLSPGCEFAPLQDALRAGHGQVTGRIRAAGNNHCGLLQYPADFAGHEPARFGEAHRICDRQTEAVELQCRCDCGILGAKSGGFEAGAHSEGCVWEIHCS